MPTARKPHVFKTKEGSSSQVEIDHEKSGAYKIMEALGRPRVVYSIKENKYFKDLDCKREYEDKELQEMDLPIPIQIKTKRDKMVKEMLDKTGSVDMEKVYKATLPPTVEPPDRIKDKLAGYSQTAEDRLISRLNRQTKG